MDGGDARVVVDRETRGITLIAEATFVATITVAT
jgi:hypothetical protein